MVLYTLEQGTRRELRPRGAQSIELSAAGELVEKEGA
jgi:hypothetical protein